mgnify:FL=1
MHIFIKIRTFSTIVFSLGFALAAYQLPAYAQSSAANNPSTQPKLAVILNSGSASVSLVDMQSREVIKTIPVGKEPHHLMITPDQKTLLIANAAGNDVVLMNLSLIHI